MIEEIKKIKKIELHLHLDGSVSLSLASKLLKLSVEDCKKEMIANLVCHDLSEYLTKFKLPISLMQTKENLKLIASDLVNRLEKENVLYAEIRFAPMFHTNNGLTMDSVVEAVLEGLNDNKKVKTNLILCLMRGIKKEDNLKTIEVASKYLNKGVCALDLAGDEKKFKLSDYVDLFKLIKTKNIPFTIHAGEVDELDIPIAIELGVKRIGHGVKCIDNKNLLKEIKNKNILLEVCPTSNIQTKAFESYQSHPIYKLYKENINISINTDNMTVSNTDLNQEYLNLVKYLNFTIDDLKEINLNTVNYTFLSNEEKIELLENLRN
ncbi:MAG: adenosine deaminase [Bacilli bacterium]|nr:adenosine deaminase [Bacilli bacterium]